MNRIFVFLKKPRVLKSIGALLLIAGMYLTTGHLDTAALMNAVNTVFGSSVPTQQQAPLPQDSESDAGL